MKRFVTVGVFLTIVFAAFCLAGSGLLAEPPTTAEKSPVGNDAAREDIKGTKVLTVAEARSRASLLHEAYVATLQAMHRRYFREDGKAPIPSSVLDEVFADVAFRSNIKARWMAVNANAMTLAHEPQDDFEKQAARALAAGEDEFERVESGVYRHAGAITLFSNCLKCHAPAPLRQDVRRVAALVINVPLKPPER